MMIEITWKEMHAAAVDALVAKDTRIAELEARCVVLTKALQYYADGLHHSTSQRRSDKLFAITVCYELGDIAEEALRQTTSNRLT